MTFPGQDQYSHVDDFFGGGGKSLSFDAEKGYQLGQPKGGTITAIRPKQQQTDMQSKKPLFWDDAQNDPKWTLPVDLDTDERDPQTPHDDGKRTLWVSGGVEKALRDHLRTTNAKLRPGGSILVAWVAGAGKIGDPKQYRVQYTPPAHNEADQMLTAPPAQPAAQPPAQQQQPWGGPPAAPQQAQWGQQPPAQAPQQQGMWPAQPAQPAQQQWPAQQPAAAPQQQGMWPAQPAQQQPAQQQWPAQQPAAAPQQQQQGGGIDPGMIDAAYSHLTPDQRTAIKASGMSPEQIAGVYGPPQQQGHAA